jgi:hypothetical protein
VSRSDLEGCYGTLQDEFRTIKRSYYSKILVEHPDKGGDPKSFRKTRASFEVLRDLVARSKVTSFLNHLGEEANEPYREAYEQEGAVPSYEYYEEAAQEVTPGYKVELAKSGRSQCVRCKSNNMKRAATKPQLEDESSRLLARGRVDGPERLTNHPAPVEALASAGGAVAEHNGKKRSRLVPKRKKARTEEALVAHANPVSTVASIPAGSSAAAIAQSAIRIGSLDGTSGNYGRWYHLACWRVPYRVWAGLQNPTDRSQVLLDLLRMDEVLLMGLSDLPPERQQEFVEHVIDPQHWARKTAASKSPPPLRPVKSMSPDDANRDQPDTDGAVAEKLVESAAGDSFNTAAIVSRSPNAKAKFVMPHPGVNGAASGCLEGKTFVLSGIFPEVGGGMGLKLGKDRLKQMIQAFGGRVTSAISGKTSFLVIGLEPGESKVGKARQMKLPVIDVGALVNLIYGTLARLEDAPQPTIRSYSAGYPARNRLQDEL